MRSGLPLLVTLAVWVGAAATAAAQEAQEVVPVKTVQLSTPIAVISDAGGDQFGIVGAGGSGLLVVYEELRGTISYVDVTTGIRGVVPKPDGYYDLSPDVHDGRIVFTRAHLGTFARRIYAYRLGSSEAPTALAGDEGGYPNAASIGTGVVTWVASFPDAAVGSEIVVHDLDSSATQRLTTDAFDDFEPTVSADGTVVSWTKCVWFHSDCSIWIATRDNEGVWSARSLATADTPDGSSSNGSLVTWHRFQGTGADAHADVVWTSVTGGPLSRLVLPGTFDYFPRLAGSLVAYTRQTTGTSDVWVYDVETGINYQLTNTPEMYKGYVSIWRESDGTAHVAWSAYNVTTGWDLYMTSFRPLAINAYNIVPLFQQDRSYKLGSVVPLRLQLLDDAGDNASAPGLIVTATGLLKEDSTAPATVAEDAGNASPDGGFRYDADLQGYIFNLSTRGLTVGTWHLLFTVTGDPATYRVTFHLR